MSVVIDNTVLSNFAHVHQPGLLTAAIAAIHPPYGILHKQTHIRRYKARIESAMPQQITPKDMRKLEAIDDLIRHNDGAEATRLALELVQLRPGLVPAWEALAEAARMNDDYPYVFYAVRRLCQMEPREEAFWHNLIVAAMQLNYVFTARQALETYVRRFPGGQYFKTLSKLDEVVTKAIDELIEAGEVPESPGSEGLALLETSRLWLSLGRYADARRDALDAARRLPADAAPPLNNISLSYLLEGDYLKALNSTEECLKVAPDNAFALALKAQILVRLGRSEEARLLLEAFGQQGTQKLDHWEKIMESCALAHEHRLLLDTYARAGAFFKSKQVPIRPTMYLLAGSAYAFLGDRDAARREWKQIPKGDPAHETAARILHELPVYGPWYFPLNFWIPREWIESLSRAVERASSRSESNARRELARWLERMPGAISTMSLLFERGDSAGVDFVIGLADFYPVPGLAEFAQGQRGSDALRARAASLAVQHGMIPESEPVTITFGNERAQLKVLEISFDTEPSTLPASAQKHMIASHDALQARNAERALKEAEAGLKIAPGDHTLINYQINALYQLDRPDEADALTRALAEAEPDYLFARAGMAGICIRDDRLDEAQKWLEPLLNHSRFHISEFRALALTQMNLLIARQKFDRAQEWLEMLTDIDPDSVPEDLRTNLELVGSIEKLMAKSRKRKKRK